MIVEFFLLLLFPPPPQVRDALNTFWNGSGKKSQKKVLYLMNLVGFELIKYVRDLLPNVWHSKYFGVMSMLQAALMVLEQWAKGRALWPTLSCVACFLAFFFPSWRASLFLICLYILSPTTSPPMKTVLMEVGISPYRIVTS